MLLVWGVLPCKLFLLLARGLHLAFINLAQLEANLAFLDGSWVFPSGHSCCSLFTLGLPGIYSQLSGPSKVWYERHICTAVQLQVRSSKRFSSCLRFR
eukprot:jgi/Botrbrau1/20699/Bobra.0058s0028.1